MKKAGWENMLVILITGAYVWMFLRLFFSGKTSYYVHPDFVPLTMITGLVLLIILMFLIVSFGYAEGGKLSGGLLKHKIRLVFAIFPILLFIVFQPKALSSQAFLTRSVGQTVDLGFSRSNEETVEFVLNSENRELVDWIRLFAQNAEPENYAGMKAKITGFVLKDDTLPSEYFILARFVVSCCAADARPVGLTVKYDQKVFNLQAEQWLEIRGEFVVEDINGERKPVLLLKEKKLIEVPANPYIS